MSTISDKKILVCTNYRANPNTPSCGARDSDRVFEALSRLNLGVPIEKSPCLGMCNEGPNVRLVPNGACFHAVSTGNLNKLIKDIKLFTAC